MGSSSSSSSSLEGSFIFSLLLSSLTVGYCHGDSCRPLSCSRVGPLIRFPFRIKHLQPHHCGYPGFDLSCKGNDTTIHIPSLPQQELFVRRIDYKLQKLVISDPNDCLYGLLFNNTNNLSSSPSSPFHYYRDPSSYTLLRCSRNVDFGIWYTTPVPCLGDLEHEVFAVSTSRPVGSLAVSCLPIKTVEIYPPYYGVRGEWQDKEMLGCGMGMDCETLLDMKWDVPGCDRECELNGGECRIKNQTNNEAMCFYHRDKGSWRKYVIIGGGVGFFLLLAAIMTGNKVYYSWKLKKKLDLEDHMMVEKFLKDYDSLKPTRFSFADLKRMTNQFREKLGEGGYGSVFKGRLPNGTFVAVKILKTFGGDGKEFINEVGTIGMIHHVNVVRLLGFCADRLKRALIYEFLPNQSLERFIFSGNTSNHFLGWEKLQDIAMGVARGIEYLHQGCNQRILHFDIKPHNILLDMNFNPKISDFGLAKLCSKGQSVVSMAAARGTVGYIAPEVYSRNFGNVSYKSDIYSFGMLLLEMVGGRKNIDVTVDNTSGVYFPEWIYNRLCQNEDTGLKIPIDEDAMIAKKLTIVALWCIQWNPVDRPSMTSVIQMLEGNVESLTMPPNPFSSTAPKNIKSTNATNLLPIFE